MSLILIIFSSFPVLAATYRIDDHAGNVFRIDTGNLQWRIRFIPYGSQLGPYTDDSNLPRLTVRNGTDTIINFSSRDTSIDTNYYQKDWYAYWKYDFIWDTFTHPMRWTESGLQPIGPGTYDFEAYAYGNCLSEAVLDYWYGGPSSIACTVYGISCGTSYDCGSGIWAWDCDECQPNPNNCYGNDTPCGWTCNGLDLRVVFYDGNTPIRTISGLDWEDRQYIDYFGDPWITSADPSFVNVAQTLDICEDECGSVGEQGCDGSSREWTCAENLTTHCYYRNHTDCGSGEICVGPINECTTQLTGAYWADMRGSPINQTNLSDRVSLIVPGLQLGSQIIEYEIYKVGGGFWFLDSLEAQFSDRGFTTWVTNETGEHYFRARIEDGEWIDSQDYPPYGILDVLDGKDNLPPVAEIVSPEKCSIYFTDEVISFNQTSYDVDDNLTVEWDFGDGQTSYEYNTTHFYTTGGQKTIILTVTDERGLQDDDMITVLIIDANIEGEKYVCGDINDPEWGEERQSLEILFNASESYAINASGCDGSTCMIINCLAGDCKQETAISQIPVLGFPNWAGFDNLNFSWTFDDGTSYRGEGFEGAVFRKLFDQPGVHQSSLNISINPGGSTETKFLIRLITECQRDVVTGDVIWWDDVGFPHDTLDPLEFGVCLGENQLLDPPNCCPAGYACIETIGGDPYSAICQVSEAECSDIVACDDYTDQPTCQNDTCGVAFSQPGNTCGGIVEVDAICGAEYFTSRGDACRCEWNGTSCQHKVDLWSTIYDNFPVIHSCSETTEHGECVDSIMSVRAVGSIIWNETYIAELQVTPQSELPPDFPFGGSEAQIRAYLDGVCAPLAGLCGSYKGISLCGKPLVRLDFFTLKNLIIAVCIIAIIYAIWLAKKRR